MSDHKIIIGKDNPLLRRQSSPVKKIDAAVKTVIKEMEKVLAAEKGLGLAAPQIGENIRVILTRLNHNTPQEMVMTMINPELLSLSDDEEIMEEGCLSLPGVYGQVSRPAEITVKFFTVQNQKQVLQLSGLNARVVQHETDHLNGILFVDKLVEAEVTQEKERIPF